MLPYIPARRISGAAARPRDLTLPTGFITPSLPMTAFAAPSGHQWLHEIKLDGFRIIARNDGQRVRLYGRSGDDLTHTLSSDRRGNGSGFPTARSTAKPSHATRTALRHSTCCNVACEMTMWSSLHSISSSKRAGIGAAMRLYSRKADLDRLVADAGPGVLSITWVDGEEFEGPALFEQACSLGLEGIVSKRKDSRYMSGRSPYWLKMNNPASDAARRHPKDGDREEG